ncbi:UDP-N-acetylmuramoyl-L-alanine--D-glutamate ligase [Luteimonas yindakuii]|uniref:UDP-N-acetylmuramoyl-L-alanine--L-glutamate ligase n=1 Tax=Luteimonas yindakuii TaxID=2565782 RepID=A0A4Z1RH77_9GAMM|nr:UDP-N-acetylmuramoyl-L-alanine--D-glutamate ligase [Luteimonas yindakuii]
MSRNCSTSTASTASPRRCGSGCVHASPPDIAALEGRRVGLWGWGREGRAAWRAIRSRQPALPLTLFCQPGEADDAARLGDPLLQVCTAVDADALAACDVVIKSPGISPYGDVAQAAAGRGTRFIGGTTLWFAERGDARTLCVTGTKGKSTTTALLAHLLRAAGVRTALAGNIGLPLLELLDGQADAWAIELSSYQTRDVATSGVRPDLAIVTNIFPEHLDWHGGQARYVEDKLALLGDARPHIAVLNAADPTLAALRLPDSDVRWYGRADGWHLRDDTVFRGDSAVLDTRDLPLPGRHNRGNLCAVLAALEACGHDAVALAAHARGFQPLPHRLQPLGRRDRLDWVNDSISTTPHASIAALELYRDRPVAILVGGHDRGLDWAAFVDHVRAHPPRAVVTMGQNGPRIHDALRTAADEAGFALRQAGDLEFAVAQAREVLAADGGVLLLSPGAPSFGPYRDYAERGRHFACLGGFDPDAITAIPGLGIA